MNFLLFLFLVQGASAYKILVFSPTISRSHMISNGRIADELAKAGHDVVLFEPDFLNIFEKVQAAKLARRWPVKGFNDDLLRVIWSFSRDLFEDSTLWEMNRGDRAYQAAFDSMCKQLIDNDQVMEQLRDEQFDAFFSEHINLCGHGVAHALAIKIHFWVSSCPVFESMAYFTGMPSPFSYIPAGGMTMSVRPTYFERARNIVYGVNGFLMAFYDHWRTTRVFRDKFGSDFPFVAEIAADSDVIFVSTDEFIEIPRPVMPNMVNIGGLGGGSEQHGQLDETWELVADRGPKGIIYFSLGTVVNTTLIAPSFMKNLVQVAKAFPQYHMILRVDSHDQHARRVVRDVPNMSVHNWVPQPALLNHPKMRLFITHAGYNGVTEAARAGVPLLTTPFMWDQPKNSMAVARNDWGLPINRRVLRDDPAELVRTVRELLTDDRFVPVWL